MADVDVDAGVLCIRESRFYKSRLVPIGDDLPQILAPYAARRHQGHAGAASPFFVSPRGSAVTKMVADLLQAQSLSKEVRRASVAKRTLVLFGATPFLGGEGAFTAAVVARIGAQNVFWLIGLVAASEIVRLLNRHYRTAS
jgi:hypothetical protein